MDVADRIECDNKTRSELRKHGDDGGSVSVMTSSSKGRAANSSEPTDSTMTPTQTHDTMTSTQDCA